jgi:hypothetical protein
MKVDKKSACLLVSLLLNLLGSLGVIPPIPPQAFQPLIDMVK